MPPARRGGTTDTGGMPRRSCGGLYHSAKVTLVTPDGSGYHPGLRNFVARTVPTVSRACSPGKTIVRILIVLAVAFAVTSHAVGQNDLRRAIPRSTATQWPNSAQPAATHQLYAIPANGHPQRIPHTTPWRYTAQYGLEHSLVRPAWKRFQVGARDGYRVSNSDLPHLNIVPRPYDVHVIVPLP